jgi:sugar-phosphatase
MLEGKRLLIFDFDGTLADTSPLHAAAFHETLSPLGLSVHYPDIAGLRTGEAMRAALGRAGHPFGDEDIAGLAAGKQRLVRRLISQALEPLPGVDSFLHWARCRYRLAIYSSGSRVTLDLALNKLGYCGWFDPLISGDDVTKAKPAPEGFLRVLALSQIHCQEAVVFEDSEAGIRAAQLAGLDVIDVRIADFSILCECIDIGK